MIGGCAAAAHAGSCAMWMNSPGHRRDPALVGFRRVGVGARTALGGTKACVVTADFGSRASSTRRSHELAQCDARPHLDLSAP